MPGFDMHIHSTASDGVWSPAEIINYAQSIGLDGVAITDHDTVAGLDAAFAAGAAADFPVIGGVEISTEYNNRDIHILGYWLDYKNTDFLTRLAEMQDGRVKRCLDMADRLHTLGMPLDVEKIMAQNNGSVGRPHLARAMVEAGYVGTVREAFQKWLGRGMPAYMPRPKMRPSEAVDIIRLAGGAPVVAHPGQSVPDVILDKLIRYGIAGIEVYHPDHNRRMEQKYLMLARRFRLAFTGGSDFHGNMERPIGFKTTPLAQVERLASLR